MRRLAPPFPNRLRIVPSRNGSRRRLLLLAAGLIVAMLLAMLPSWRVQSVTAALGTGVPAAATRSLVSLRGTPVLLLNLRWVRRIVEVWPAAGAVEVQLQMPGKLLVHATPAGIAGSVRIGRSWHAVTPRGGPGVVLRAPVPPVLTGFEPKPVALRSALSVADRVARETGGRVLSVTSILPDDLEVHVVTAGRGAGPLVLHVAHEPAAGEVKWTRMIREGKVSGTGWADLRFDDRVVVGDAG